MDGIAEQHTIPKARETSAGSRREPRARRRPLLRV